MTDKQIIDVLEFTLHFEDVTEKSPELAESILETFKLHLSMAREYQLDKLMGKV